MYSIYIAIAILRLKTFTLFSFMHDRPCFSFMHSCKCKTYIAGQKAKVTLFDQLGESYKMS